MNWRPQHLLLAGLVALAAGLPHCPADDAFASRDASLAVRRILVPRDRPEEWPRGSWRPWRRDEFDKALAAARNAPDETSGAILQDAVYRARLAGPDLLEGDLEFHLRPNRAAVLPLDPMQLRIAQASWQPDQGAADSPAWLGTASDGRLLLLLDGNASRLVGRFSLSGRKLARGAEFDLRLAPAVVSRFLVTVSDDVSAVIPGAAAEVVGRQAGQTTWRFELGSRSVFRLRVAPHGTNGAAPLLVARSNLNFVVQTEVTRFRSEFQVESLGAPASALRLVLAPDVVVTAVELEGAPVLWRDELAQNVRLVHVTLPAPVAAGVMQLTVQGLSAANPSGNWRPPAMHLEGAVELESRLVVRTLPPFRAADLRAVGYRQVDFSASARDGETFFLRKERPDATLELIPERSRAEVTARSINLLEPAGARWKLTSRVSWSAASGQPQEFQCLLPPGWRPVAVNLQGESDDESVDPWYLAPAADGRQALHVMESGAAAAAGESRFAELVLDRPAPPVNAAVDLPVVIAGLEQGAETTLIVRHGLEAWRVAPLNSDFRQLETPELPEDLSTISWVAAALKAPATIWSSSAARPRGAFEPRPIGSRQPARAPRATRPRDSAPAAPKVDQSPAVVRAKVHLAGVGGGEDRYRLQVEVPPRGAGDQLAWRLDPAASLATVRCGGRAVAVERQGNRFSLALSELLDRAGIADAAGPAGLELEYTVPAAALTALPTPRRLYFPRFEHPIGRFELQVAHLAAVEVSSRGLALRRTGDAAEIGGKVGAWGPLARTGAGAVFNPFDSQSWRAPRDALWPAVDDPEAARPSPDGVSAGAGQPAEGLVVHEAAGVDPNSAGFFPDARLMVWRRDRATALCWCCLIVGCLVVAGLRRVDGPLLGFLAALSWLLSVTGAVALGPVLADWSGSLAVGMVIGFLLPMRQVPSGRPKLGVPHAAGLASLVAILGCAALAAAQEAVAPLGPERGAASAPPDGLAVLVPVADAGGAGEQAEFVYVNEAVQAVLERALALRRAPPYLIAVARYNVSADEFHRILIHAEFDVRRLNSSGQVLVELPFSGLNLAPRDPCTVDGRPADVLHDARQGALLVGLPAPAEGMDGPPPAVPHRVALRFYASVNQEAAAGAIAEFSVPAVHAAYWRLAAAPEGTFDLAAQSAPAAGIPGGAATNRELIRLFWRKPGGGAEPRPRLEARASCLAEVGAAAVQWQCRARYEPRAASVAAVAWRLPNGARVRDVQAGDLLRWAVEPAEEGGSMLLVEFGRPRTGPFELLVTALTPVSEAFDGEILRLPQPAADWDGSTHELAVLRYYAGVRLGSEAPERVAAPASPSDEQTAISIDEFARDWPAEASRPQQAFSLAAPLALRISVGRSFEARPPRFELRGRVARDRIDWTWVAQIGASDQPRYQYRVAVDARLTVRRVAVEEDGAPRLLRWSRADETLVLFLTDRAVRSQIVRIDATMPASGPEVRLPRLEPRDLPPGPTTILLECEDNLLLRLAPQAHSGEPPARPGTDPHHPGDPRVIRAILPEGSQPPLLRLDVAARAEQPRPERGASESNAPDEAALPSEQAPAAAPPAASPTAGSPSGLGPDAGQTGSSGAPPASSSARSSAGQSLHVALALLAAFCLLVVARGMQRLAPGSNRIRLALLGLFWWAALVPSWLGPVFWLAIPWLRGSKAQPPSGSQNAPEVAGWGQHQGLS